MSSCTRNSRAVRYWKGCGPLGPWVKRWVLGFQTIVLVGAMLFLAVLFLAVGAPAPAGASSHTKGQKLGSLRVTIPKDTSQGVVQRFRRLARGDDKKRLWQRALLRWKVVAAYAPKDKEAANRIEAIETWQEKQAAKHLAIASAHLKKKNYGQAFKSFLRTLAYDGKNHMALSMVKFDLNARSLQAYRVVKGDSPVRIAKKAYNDADLVFLVQYFNNLKRNARLTPGTTLNIPVMADVLVSRPAQVAVAKSKRTPPRAPRATAQAATPPRAPSPPAQAATPPRAPSPPAGAKSESTPPVAAAGTTQAATPPRVPSPPAVAKAQPVPKEPSVTPAATPAATPPPQEPPPAPTIVPSESTLVAALEAGAGAGSALGDLASSSGESEYSSSEAEIGVRHAQRLYEDGQFADAAAQAESVLEDDPTNTKAKNLVNSSYYALGQEQVEKGDKLAAIQAFSRAEENYKDSAARKTSLAGDLQDQQAEVHYIAGVTFYLAEDLDNAIREWEEVVRLDPAHLQAPKDLANARALKAKLAQVQ